MMRALLRRVRGAHRDQAGFTLVEVIATVVILGIIMVPLGTAMVVGFRTVLGIQDRLSNSADVQKLSTYFPSDVASADADGVNPVRVQDEGICKATATEQSLITFRWDSDLGDNGQTVVRYLGIGSGSNSSIVRRICRGSAAPVETVLASHFGVKSGPEAATYLTDRADAALQTPVCGVRECYIDIHGSYDFHLDAQRRVEGANGSNRAPGAPTNVHALGGFNRARLFFTDPVDTGGLPITGYYIEATPGGIVGGATPTFYTPGSGTSGAVIPNLTNGQSYTFRVRAVTIVGNGPWSDPSNPVTPGPTSPEPPTLVAAAGDPNTGGRVTASWSLAADYSNGGSAITGFRLTALSPDATATSVDYMNSGTFSGAVTGLNDNTKYKIQVTALNSYGEGSPSPVPITALTRPGQPGTPTAGASGTAGSVVLNFTLPTAGDLADLTNVRAHVGASFTTPVDIPTACPDLHNCSITVSGVNVSSSATVTVQAQNATGWGAESNALVIPADTTPPTVAITFPNNPQYGTGPWNAGCSNAGGAICGTAADNFPGAVASVTLTIRRSSDNRYWNGSAGTGTSQWSTSVQNLTATGTTSWTLPFTTASLSNGVTYTVTAVAKDTVNQSSTTATRTFAYVTGNPTAALTAPANGANVQGSVLTVSGTAGATSPATVSSADFQYKPSAGSTWTSIAVDTVSPYTTPWDTTALPDGSYDLRLVVTDSAGNTTTSATRTITVDSTPPTGNITAPANGAYVRGSSVTVSANSADATSGVANATFQYKPTAGVTWTQIGAADTSSPYSVAWNSTTLADGSYDLRVITTDNVGLQLTSPVIAALVDNTNPTIGSPTVTGTLGANGWYTSNVTVTWPAPTDAGGIASSTGCGPTNINANTTGQVVTCSATDNAGNTATSSVTVKVDKNAPTGSLTAPASGSAVTGLVTVSSDSADVGSGVANATFQYSPAGAGTWNQIGAPDTTPGYGVSWNTATVAEGSYDLRVITTDLAGLTVTSAVRTVTVDRTNPTVTITFPANGTDYNAAGWAAGCVNNDVCGTASDAGGLANVNLTIRRNSDNRYWNGSAGTSSSQWSSSVQNLTVNGTTAWDRVFTTASIQTGVTYTVTATATDNVGLTGTATNVFDYDTTNPTGSITAPAANANVTGTVNVTSNSADAGPGSVASALFEYKPTAGSTWTAIGAADVSSPYSAAWNTSALADGQYDLRVTTVDNAGNSFTSATVTVRIDSVKPTGELTAPANGAVVGGGAVTVSSSSADAGSGVANAQFQYSPAGAGTWNTIGNDASFPYSVSWNTTALTQGSYDLRVITTDVAGNSYTSLTRTVSVDSVAPTVTITKPVDTAAYNNAGWATGCATNDVCGTAADSGPGTLAGVSVTIRRSSDNRYWNGTAGNTQTQWSSTTAIVLPVNGTTAWNRVLTTASLTNNTTYTMTATATDGVGLTGTATSVFVYDLTAPTGSITAPAGGANVRGNAVTVSSSSADTAPGTVASATFQRSPSGANTWTTIGAPATSSPYSVAWDSTAVADGQYDLRVITTDTAGNASTSSTVTVRVDNTLPTGSITAPTAGAILRGTTVAVSSSSADAGSGVANATFQRSPSGAGTWTTIGAADTVAPYSQNFDTTTVADGQYDLRVLTTDNAGNVFTSPVITVKVDNTGPTIIANATGTVGSNGWYTTNIGLTWTVTDPVSGVATQTNCGPQTFSADSSSISVTCNATDNAGNAASGTFTAKRDATNPTGSLTAPTASALVRGSSVTVSSNSADALSGVANATFQRSPAGAGIWTTIATDTVSPYSQSWDTTAVSDGSYDLRVITTDGAGNPFTSAIVTVTVDNTRPVPTSVTLSNGAGQTLGQAGTGDKITITYSEPLAVNTLCTTWSGNGSDQTISNVTVLLNSAGSQDYVTFGGVCSNIGNDNSHDVNTNADYISSGPRTFSNSTITWTAVSRTLTVTFGAQSGANTNTVGSNTTPQYTPTTNIADLAGNTTAGNTINGTPSRF